MLQSGQIVTFRFPQTDLAQGKLRPALLVAQLPGSYGDWLTCMISSQVKQFVPTFDELITPNDQDFSVSGLSTVSVIRSSRLAVASEGIFVGRLGEISHERHVRIRQRLIEWLRTT